MKNISSKIVLTISTIVFAVAATICFISINLTISSTKSTIKEILLEMAKLASASTEHRIKAYENIVAEISKTSLLSYRHYSDKEKYEFILNKQQSFGFIDSDFIDVNGYSQKYGKNVSSEEYFVNSIAGNYFISDPIISEDGKSSYIQISAPVFGFDNNVVAVILFVEDGKVLTDAISDIHITDSIDSSSFYILNKEGRTIAYPLYDFVLESANTVTYALENPDNIINLGLAEIEQKMINGETGIGEYEYYIDETDESLGTEMYIQAYAPIFGTDGWSIAVTINQNRFMHGAYSSVYIIIGITCFWLFVSILFAVLFGNSISKPIKKCARRLEMLAQGDFKSEVPSINTKDETKILAISTQLVVNNLNAIVEDLSNAMRKISTGDLDCETTVEYTGDFITLKESVSQIIDNLNVMIRQIAHSASQVAKSAGQMSSGALSLSQGSAVQASAVEQIAYIINEISKQSEDALYTTKDMIDVTHNTSLQVENGNLKMREMTQAMSEISAASVQISKIIKSIDDIAFQTNLLALNAAVESERAGEAGKGFSVVADEVRNLANRSAKSAKETDSLIANTKSLIEKGTKIAEQTAKSLIAISESQEKSNNLIAIIEKNANEQVEAINLIKNGMEQVESVVQINSATSEESAAISSDIQKQSNELEKMSVKFKLKSDTSLD